VSSSKPTAVPLTPSASLVELDLDAVLAAKRRDRAFVAPSRFPPATIDLAFVLAHDVPAADVLATIIDAGEGMVEHARCFDEFRSDALGPGNHSLAFRVRYRAADRTLTDAEVGDLRQQAIRAVEQRHGGELRGEAR
jgi:phenylalanyl-tRNA synthetase beta chain